MTIEETIADGLRGELKVTRDIITEHELKTLPLSHFYERYKKTLEKAVELEDALNAVEQQLDIAYRRHEIAKEYHGQME